MSKVVSKFNDEKSPGKRILNVMSALTQIAGFVNLLVNVVNYVSAKREILKGLIKWMMKLFDK